MDDEAKQHLDAIFEKLGWDAERIFKRQRTYDGHLMRHLVQAIIADDEAITESDQKFALDRILEDHEGMQTENNAAAPKNTAKLTYKRAYNFMERAEQQRFFEVASELGYLGRLRNVITHDESAFPIKIAQAFSDWYSSRLAEQEITGNPEDDIIVRKQVWFDRPDLVLIARELSSEEYSAAMGIENYDYRKSKKIRELINLSENTHGFNMGREVLGTLNAIAAADAEFEYKKIQLFAEMLNLSKVSDKTEEEFKKLPKTGFKAIQEIANHPAIINAGEAAGWTILLRDRQMRETAFDHVKKYDLTAPFYFLLNSKHAYVPQGAAEIFSQWCQSEGINLRQALVDYELIDLSKPKSDVDLKIPLASHLIRYGISTSSEHRNAKLSTLSAEDLQAAPMGERDHAWFAHHVQKTPSYIGDRNVIDAISELVKKTAASDATRKHFGQTLSKQPELFTPPVPALWVEYETGENQVPKTAFLLERLPGNKPGLRVMQFVLHGEHGVLPNKDSPIFYSITEPSGDELATTVYKNNVPFQPQSEADLAFVRTTASMLHFVVSLNDTSQPLKFTPPSEDSTDTEDKPMGIMTLTGSSITLDMEKAPSILGINAPIALPSPEPEQELDESEETPTHTEITAEILPPADNDEPEEKEKPPKSVALDGVVIQRIFREAGKTHRNNSPEREDDIARMGRLSEQLRALGSLENINVNFEPHGELADMLFNDNVMRALEFSHLFPNGKKSVPAVPAAIKDNLRQRLKGIFAIASDDTDIRPDDLERNERLKEHILKFPGLVIAGLGDDQLLRQARDKYNIPLLSDITPYVERDSVKRAALTFERSESARTLLMNTTGIELPAIEPVVQSPVETSSAEESQEDSEDQSPIDLPTEEIKEANEQPENLVFEEPQHTPEAQSPTEVFLAGEVNEQPVNQIVEAAQIEEGIQVPAVFSGITADLDTKIDGTSTGPLSEDEKLDILFKYDEAFARTQERLLADTQMYLMRALNRKCNQFNCFIDLNKPGFAIHLRFFGEVDVEGEKRTRTEFHVLDNYDEVYKELDIPLTMENAVDLKISVQSLILNTEGVVPTSNLTASGSATVARDTQMPLPMLDYSIVKDTSGMCAFVYEAQDPYTRKVIKPRIPLGFAMRYEDEAAEQRELDERTEFILNYLGKIENHRTPEGFRVHVYKRDVMAKLQSWLEANDKEWETAERIALPGFEKDTLIHVFSQSAQKISLAPISLAMDVGGENPSWHCRLSFYIGDKDSKPMGDLVRGRSLYLRTRNSQLAVARTLESLLGVQNRFKGLLPTLQEHMRATGDEWRVEKEDKGDVFIGSLKLQDFLDDMMRYERDIGVKLEKREENANGNITITLQALRCLIGDHGGTVKPVPERVYERQGDTRKSISFSVMVPQNKTDLIDLFVKNVDDHINWLAEEAYSSIALGQDGQLDKRKNPLEYRTSQIRNSLIRAVEAIYESHFGKKLSKNWHTPENQTALSSGATQDNSSFPKLGL